MPSKTFLIVNASYALIGLHKFQMLARQVQGEGASPHSEHGDIAGNIRLTSEGNSGETKQIPGVSAVSCPPLWSFASVRLNIMIALALAYAIEGLMRSNINMAMVCMVNRTAISIMTAETVVDPPQSVSLGNSSLSLTSPNGNGFTSFSLKTNATSLMRLTECTHAAEQYKNGTNLADIKEFEGGDLVISKQKQSMIFTSFYLGGLLIILPGSYLCDRLGPTRLVFFGASLNVFGTLFTPFVARNLGPIALVVVRFLMGCGQGILVPCVTVLISHWFPLSEKSTAIAISTIGNQISVVLAMFVTAELCGIRWLGGWASSFYIYSVIGVAFCAVWKVFVRDYPSQAKHIRPDERRFIETHGGRAKGPQKIDPNGVPWHRILKSMVVWSTGLSSFSQNFMNVGIVVYLPTYYYSVLGMDLASNGLMSALPFIVQLFSKILFAGVADWIKDRRLMSPTAVTKLFNLVASLGSGLCFILLSLCDCRTPYLAISLAVCAIGISSGFIPGYNTSVVCIAPRFTSSIASFSRLIGQIASVVSPYGIGIIVASGTKTAWQFAFWGMAAILFSTGVLFQIFGSASVQEWAVTPTPADPSDEAYHHLAKLETAKEGSPQRERNIDIEIEVTKKPSGSDASAQK